jgi:alcohol dehydrogenase
MTNIFQQVQPVCPIVFGAGTLTELPCYIKSYRGTRVFCICGEGIKNAHIIDNVTKLLDEQGIFYVVYDGVQHDTPDYIVDEAAEMARQYKCDLVIGVGGGSCMDTAKAVSVLLDNPGKISEYYSKDPADFTSRTPLILLPTSSGTGSEVTKLSVIHDSGSDTKIPVFRCANLTIVDCELTISTSPAITAASGFDALAHALEAYTSKYHTEVVDSLALQAIRLIVENLLAAYDDGTNIIARENLAFASNIAGIAFNEVSVHVGHAIAHEFGLRFNLSHGVACALTLTTVMHDLFANEPERAQAIAEIFGFSVSDVNEAEPSNAIDGHEAEIHVRNRIHQMLKATKIPSLKDLNVSLEQALSCAQGAIDNNQFLDASPVPVTLEYIENAIRFLYNDY